MPDETAESDTDAVRITVEGASVEAIAGALDLAPIDDQPPQDTEVPPELTTVFDTLHDIFEGTVIATENDSRGRSRKMIRQYADREDLDSTTVGHCLRVLEVHGVVAQDGNRWRIPESPDE